MMILYPNSNIYNRLLDHIQAIPVIDCHEHLSGFDSRIPYKEPISVLTQSYMQCDLYSAAFGVSLKEFMQLSNPDIPTDEKWPLFERLWRATEHTAYARVTKLVLQNTYGESQMSRAALDRVAEKLASMDEAAYFRTIDAANIQAMIVDVLGMLPDTLGSFLDGKKTFPPKWRLMIALPNFHNRWFTYETIQNTGRLLDKHITSLDEYLEAVYAVFQRCMERGAIGIKDQSAYERIISYDLVPQAEAEKHFNILLSDPRSQLGWPEGKPLYDFLFHQYMRFARELKLPVQLHTGHMAGVYNQVNKANAAHLGPVLELHQDVRFDLFHGNWPYMGDLLFLGKNYPNVSLDLCWLHMIDPAYAIELMERAVLTVPHTKIHGFGGDYGDEPEFIAAHLQIARQNMAAAFANLVEGSWLDEEQALCLAKDWLYNNPNHFFKLGFKDI
ncbi:MAG: amidohydrolase family protein [Omnitrophica WOR_2 bacterium]